MPEQLDDGLYMDANFAALPLSEKDKAVYVERTIRDKNGHMVEVLQTIEQAEKSTLGARLQDASESLKTNISK